MIPGIGCRGRDSNPRSHGIPGKKSEHDIKINKIIILFFIKINKIIILSLLKLLVFK